MSFDERSYKLTTLAVESFGRLGKEGSDLIDQVAASIVGGTDGTSLAREDICKERLLRMISATNQVVISRRVHRCKLRSAMGPPAARGGKEPTGGVLMSMTCGLNVDEE